MGGRDLHSASFVGFDASYKMRDRRYDADHGNRNPVASPAESTSESEEQMAAQNVFSSKGDVAYFEVRRRILNAELPAGSRVAQYDLASELGMSITPIREALRRLSSEGLVAVDAHRDVRVAGISADEGRQLFEIRLALEPDATALAAGRRTDEELAAMKVAATRLLPVTRQWGDEAVEAHSAFHRSVYAASGNAAMIGMLDELWAKLDRYRRAGLQLPDGAAPRVVDHEQHLELLALIERGDAEAASALARKHIADSLTSSVLQNLEEPAG